MVRRWASRTSKPIGAIKKSTNRGLAVVESIVDGKPDNTPMEFEYRKEGGKWKPVE